jgi:hypothetical protein
MLYMLSIIGVVDRVPFGGANAVASGAGRLALIDESEARAAP